MEKLKKVSEEEYSLKEGRKRGRKKEQKRESNQMKDLKNSSYSWKKKWFRHKVKLVSEDMLPVKAKRFCMRLKVQAGSS